MSRRRAFALVFGAYTAFGCLLFFYRYLDFVVRQNDIPFYWPLMEEFSGAYASAALFPAIVYFARRHRFSKDTWLRTAPLHFAAICCYSAIHTSAMWGSREAICQLAGLGHYDYGLMPLRYAMEFPSDVIGYSIIVISIYLFDNYRELREREVRLARAQLENLRLQLQPHFLFNALNTISSVMYEDPRTADVMLSRLSDLLRLTLKNPDAQEVRLSDELANLDAYLKIMQARFEERLTVEFKLEPGTEEALVPQLILQPLLENSIRHGANPRSSEMSIGVTAARSNGSLVLKIQDTGPGMRSPAPPWGIGLTNTRDRLEHLYGSRQRLLLENPDGGGLLVTVEMPYRA
jgi:two-component sensor histidine kinase